MILIARLMSIWYRGFLRGTQKRKSSFCVLGALAVSGCLPAQNPPDEAVIRVSPTVSAQIPNGGALDIAISADGGTIAFSSLATNLVFALPAVDNTSAKSTNLGAVTQLTSSPLPIGPDRFLSGASLIDRLAKGASLEAENSRVATLQLNSNAIPQIYVFDIAARVLTIVSVSTSLAPANGFCSRPALSCDGRFVCYLSAADNLVSSDNNGVSDVFMFDRQTSTTTRISVSDDGAEADGASIECDISGDGNVVAFTSLAENLVDTDVNGVPDIFVRDLASNTTTRVNLSTDGLQAVAPSGAPSISDDGNVVAFHSDTDRLVENDTNDARDVFVHFRDSGETQRLLTRRGFEPDGDNFSPKISGDGHWVSFVSRAANMIDNDVTSSDDVYLTEIATGRVFLCTVDEGGEQLREGGASPSISFDGSQVAFVVQRNKFDETTRRDFVDTDILLYRRSQETTTGILANAVPATLSPCAGLLCPEAPTTTMPRLAGDGCVVGYLLSDQSVTVPEAERRCDE